MRPLPRRLRKEDEPKKEVDGGFGAAADAGPGPAAGAGAFASICRAEVVGTPRDGGNGVRREEGVRREDDGGRPLEVEDRVKEGARNSEEGAGGLGVDRDDLASDA